MALEAPAQLTQGAVGPLRFRRLDGGFVVTNDWGRWALLEPDEFLDLLRGELPEGRLRTELEGKGFVKRALDVEEAGRVMLERRSSVAWGPYFHLFHLGTTEPMSVETADRCLDVAFGSTSPRIDVGFTGALALDAGPVLDRVVDEARRRGAEVDKPITFHLWSDLVGVAEPRLAWLIEHAVHVHARVGPEALADPTSPVWAALRRLSEAARATDEARRPEIELVVPAARALLGEAEAIVRAATDSGCTSLRLTPPAPPPLGPPAAEAVALDAWLDLQRSVVEALLAARAEGAAPSEHGTALLARRILTDADPYDVELRSPATDGTGQLCYAWDGTVCTSEAGCILYERGDGTFVLGRAGEASYRAIMGHPTVRTLLLATLLDGQPGCGDCAYLPYCGQSPVHNHLEHGTVQGRMADSAWCRRLQASADGLFRLLRDGDPATRAAVETWAGAHQAPCP